MFIGYRERLAQGREEGEHPREGHYQGRKGAYIRCTLIQSVINALSLSQEAAKLAQKEHKTAEKLSAATHTHENAAIALQRAEEEAHVCAVHSSRH